MPFVDFFTTSIKIQLFYSLGITLFLYALVGSGQDLNYLIVFNEAQTKTDVNAMAGQIQTNFTSQTKFGVVDVAALALFSGNMFIDLILNFFTAIPSLVSLVVEGILKLVPIDATIKLTIITYVYGVVAILYAISLILFLLNVRNRTIGVV